MYYDEFFPFYAAYADPLLYERENIQEKEFALMKSWYPESVRRLQERVEQECQLLDYEGSRIYDEYPDRWMLRRMCRDIRETEENTMEAQMVSSEKLEELTEVLLYQEISRRRCRRRRCHGY